MNEKRKWLPKVLEVTCLDKPGETRGVVVFQGPADTARLSIKVANPMEYESYFVARKYWLTISEKPGSEETKGADE